MRSLPLTTHEPAAAQLALYTMSYCILCASSICYACEYKLDHIPVACCCPHVQQGMPYNTQAKGMCWHGCCKTKCVLSALHFIAFHEHWYLVNTGRRSLRREGAVPHREGEHGELLRRFFSCLTCTELTDVYQWHDEL